MDIYRNTWKKITKKWKRQEILQKELDCDCDTLIVMLRYEI